MSTVLGQSGQTQVDNSQFILELRRYIDIDIENRYYRPFSHIDIDIDIAILAEKISTYFDILKTMKMDSFDYFFQPFSKFCEEKLKHNLDH